MSNVGFYLEKIETDQFATNDQDVQTDADLDIVLNITLSYGINEAEKGMGCFADIKYIHEKKTILILKLICHFTVESEAWKGFMNKKSKKIKIPSGFLQHLGVITVGTARGVIHSKTENTPYNQYYLPTVNVREIVPTDLEFNLVGK